MQAAGHFNNMLGDRVAGAIGSERIDKRFIDLQDIHVKRVEIIQIGIAGAEVINGNFIPGFAECLDDRHRFLHVNKSALGDFNFNLIDIHRIAPRLFTDLGNEPRRVEIGGRQVNRNIQMRMPGQKLPEFGK